MRSISLVRCLGVIVVWHTIVALSRGHATIVLSRKAVLVSTTIDMTPPALLCYLRVSIWNLFRKPHTIALLLLSA